MIYYLLICGVIIFDRIVKHNIAANMIPLQSEPVIANIFHITYIQNSGAAFSMWQGQWIVLVGLPVVAIIIGLVLIYLKRDKWTRTMLVAVSFICGGGLGNLIDRISMGYVVDMFDFRVFPVFNIADIFICVGCGLLILDMLISERKNKNKEE